jgi:hypothetical protein
VDASGGQFMWFIGAEPGGAENSSGAGASKRAVFFTVLTQDPYGLRDASGSLEAAADHAPAKRREGALHFIVGDGRAPGVTLLEAPFGMACAALRESVALNWASGEATPLGYRLFSPLVWLAKEAERGDDESSDVTPAPDPELGQPELMAVLDHPAFYSWFADTAAPLEAAQAASYARRFRTMSRWLAVAGDDPMARLASTIAYHFENETPQASSILAAAVSARAGDRGE